MASFATDSNHGVVNGYQGEFVTMKALSGRRAPRCDRHQFRAKMTVILKPFARYRC